MCARLPPRYGLGVAGEDRGQFSPAVAGSDARGLYGAASCRALGTHLGDQPFVLRQSVARRSVSQIA